MALLQLVKASQQAFHIEYRGFLSNHISHGLIALSGLGAPDNVLNSFYTAYSQKLIPRESLDSSALTDDQVVSLIGKEKSFPSLVGFFERELSSSGLPSCFNKWMPLLKAGSIGAAFHCAIHLGFLTHLAETTGDRQVVAEGFAYLVHSHSDLGEVPVQANSDAFPNLTQACITMSQDERFQTFFTEHINLPQYKIFKGSFQSKTRSLATFGRHLTEPYAKRMPNIGRIETTNDARKAMESIVEECITLYAGCERKNDFFLIHCVTAAWSVLQMIQVEGWDISHKEELIKHLQLAICCAYLAQRSPAIDLSALHKRIESLEAGGEQEGWETFSAKAIQGAETLDEHIPKLIFVCNDMKKRAFSDLPPKEAERKENLYLVASDISLSEELSF